MKPVTVVAFVLVFCVVGGYCRGYKNQYGRYGNSMYGSGYNGGRGYGNGQVYGFQQTGIDMPPVPPPSTAYRDLILIVMAIGLLPLLATNAFG